LVPLCEKPSGQRTIILVIDAHHTYSIAARELEQMHPEASRRRHNHKPIMVSDNAHDERGIAGFPRWLDSSCSSASLCLAHRS